MDSTSTTPGADAPREAAPVHHVAGFFLVALVGAIMLAISTPARAPISARIAAQLYAAFHLIAIGLAITGVEYALARLKRPRLAYPIAVLLLAALAYPVLGEDMSGIAEKLPHAIILAVWVALVSVLTAQAITIAAALGSLLARPWIRFVGVVLGLALAVVNGLILLQSYQGLHLLFAVSAAVLVGASLQGAALFRREIRIAPRVRRGLVAVVSVIAAVSIVMQPSNSVAVILARESTVALSPFIGRLRGEVSSAGKIPEDQRAWFSSRADLPAIPASKPSLLPQGPIVVLIGIDSLRADVIANDKHRAKLPTLFALRDESTYFTRARSAGSSTAPSIASIFASAYYSQLYWSHRPNTNDPLVWPHEDERPRLAELLLADGVRTMTVEPLGWLVNDFGIVRGFEDQVSRRPLPARNMVDKLIERLGSHGTEPLFLFAHIVDAHFPYGTPPPGGTSFDAYLAKLSVIDREINRLREALIEFRLADRTCIAVMADHGESFEEHNANTHSQNLYDEQLRVPLMFQLPGGRARTVDTQVTLVDLAPTILDLMGVETPGIYMGQSLVGFMRGEKPVLRRPIAAEARLKRGIITPDGFKVVRDPVAHSIEIFDLNKDPREENNLYADDAPQSVALLGVLDAFFSANTLKRRGYRVPYRKW